MKLLSMVVACCGAVFAIAAQIGQKSVFCWTKGISNDDVKYLTQFPLDKGHKY